MKISLSVVVPAYNEEENVAKCIQNVYSVLKKTDWDWEIIVVNDGSKDATSKLANKEIKKLGIKNARVIDNNPNRGYGGALKTGFSESKKDFITFAHADNQFDFSEIHKFVNKQQETNADIVSGIRPHGGHDPWHRLLVRWAWNTGLRAMFGYIASDVDCGFKLFRRSILERVSLPSNGAMMDTQLLAGARVRGMKIEEIEVKHLPRTAGTPTGGNLKVWMKAWKELIIFWWQLRQEILVEEGRAVFRWEAIILALILFLSAFLRLYHIDQYMTYLGDEGRDAIAVRDIVLGKHFPAIGPGTSVGSMYLGPLYYYLIAPSLLLANFSPVGPSIFVALIGVGTVFLVWWIGRQWFSRLPALAISLLYALSPVVIIYSRSSWNPNIMPFFSLLFIYGIWKVWRLGYWRWLLISAVSFGFVLNSHYLGLLLALPAGLFIFLSHRSRGWGKYLISSVALLAILMSPLLIYDLRHNWANFKSMKTFFSERQTTVNLKAYKAIPNLFPISKQVVTSIISAQDETWGNTLTWSFVILIPMGVFFGRRIFGNQYQDYIFLLTWIGASLIGLGLYKQHIYAHYFAFLFPLMFLLLGFFIFFLRRIFPSTIGKLVVTLTVFLLLVINLRANPLLLPPNNQLRHAQQIAEFIKTESGGKPFNLALLAKSNYDASYRYFLMLNDSPYYTIHQQLSDQLFVICEDPNCQPIGNPLWEVAAFGWARIDKEWEFPWGVKVYRLVHNPSGT